MATGDERLVGVTVERECPWCNGSGRYAPSTELNHRVECKYCGGSGLRSEWIAGGCRGRDRRFHGEITGFIMSGVWPS